jgi:predicted PhzF superfamily epimerase YddE/YHI9
MKLDFYQIDAFATEVFRGNPAGVIYLPEWLADETLQKIAQENNLAETAFIVKTTERFEIRWFTPTLEVDLCGHATLAAAYVMQNYYGYNQEAIEFQSKSGRLEVLFAKPLLSMIFPSRPGRECRMPEQLLTGLRIKSFKNIVKARDYLVELESREEVQKINPDMELLKIPGCLGIIVTAEGGDCDFVSRFFAPGAGIPEDPVTGSAHCTLIPYWAERLKKKKLTALQVSQRGGELGCEDLGTNVKISGKAVTYLAGTITV